VFFNAKDKNLPMVNATTAAAAVTAIAFQWEALLFGLLLIVLAVVIIKVFRNLLANAAMGVLALLALSILADWAQYPSIKIAITLVTVLISALLGLAGVGLLIILKLLGVVIQ